MERSDADVAVIGAGVMGCAIAYELSRLGYDVLVLERNLGAGTGSTGASSAIDPVQLLPDHHGRRIVGVRASLAGVVRLPRGAPRMSRWPRSSAPAG